MPTQTKGNNTAQIRVCTRSGLTQTKPSCWTTNVPKKEFEKLFKLNNLPVSQEE